MTRRTRFGNLDTCFLQYANSPYKQISSTEIVCKCVWCTSVFLCISRMYPCNVNQQRESHYKKEYTLRRVKNIRSIIIKYFKVSTYFWMFPCPREKMQTDGSKTDCWQSDFYSRVFTVQSCNPFWEKPQGEERPLNVLVPHVNTLCCVYMQSPPV